MMTMLLNALVRYLEAHPDKVTELIDLGVQALIKELHAALAKPAA